MMWTCKNAVPRSLVRHVSTGSVVLLLLMAACRAPSSPPPPSQGDAVPARPQAPAESRERADAPEVIPLDARDLLDPDRWLVVTKARANSDGGWATASFDQDRNKLIIKTRDVQRFTIDTGRIAINWERLVVLSLDGRNSELRQRDVDVLHFFRDQHGQWIVAEP